MSETPPFEIRDIDHVVIRVDGLDRMVSFYRDALGCRVVRTVESLGLVQLSAGASLIDLIAANAPVQHEHGNMDHLCLRIMPFDGAALAAHLKSFGIEAGAVETRFGAEGDGPSLYFDDPEGNRVELKGALTA